MKLFRLLMIVLAVAMAGEVRAESPRLYFSLGDDIIHGGPAGQAKAGGDTINLMASRNDPTNAPGEPFYFGDFEDEGGNQDWNGWTSRDLTQPTTHHWQVSSYNQTDPGNLAAWCGDINFPSCDDSLDPAGGYGPNWHDILEFRMEVPDPTQSSLVTATGTLQVDTEPGYDYVYFSTRFGNSAFTNLHTWDGKSTVALDVTTTFFPADYMDGTDVALYIRFKADGGWDDGDCAWPTAGAVQADDLDVHLVNGVHTLDFFSDFQDSTYGYWAPAYPPGVGDFAQIWSGLSDVYPCVTNTTPQVAFIDDGLVVPGTGGSDCINWCYGPMGYIVTTTGGLAGPDEHIHNVIESPVMEWPGSDFHGALVTAGIYRHEDLTDNSPGMFYTWKVRSADVDGDGGHGTQVIDDQPWISHNSIWYGGPDYIRLSDNVTDLMNPGRDQAQVQLGVYQLGWLWGYTGNDGYPAPYFDNVKFQVFDHQGPGMSSREIDLANDGFPERGSINFEDLGSLSVRFDMARNISLSRHRNVDFGDSIVVDVVPVREGASLFGTPVLHYTLQQNPVFDPYRTSGLPANGSAPGSRAVGASGNIDPDAWAFDLPDTGFLYPGDVLHYYIYAEDSIEGSDIRAAIMPADTTGFSTGFTDPLGFHSTFTIRALPTIMEDGFGGYRTPPVLFWNDFANRGGENEWYFALQNAGLHPGSADGYDIYYTNGPSSGVGNGLGGRAGTDLVLEHYSDMLYTSGDLGAYTLANGDFNNDSGDDLGVLTSWILQGGKDLFLTGNNLASDLAVNAGPAGIAFVEDLMGVSFQHQFISTYIDNQTNPIVRANPGNPVFQNIASWIAYGGCPKLSMFDAVNSMSGAERLAEFTNPAGNLGSYSFSAATLYIPATPGNSRIVSLPYDLMHIYTPTGDKYGAPFPARSTILRDVIAFFGLPWSHQATDIPQQLTFTATNHPNPFNPATRIFYTVPRAGHLSLKVFNIRGQLVKTLVDGRVEAGADQVAVWDGRDNRGSAVSSGVYFYEARTGGEVKVGKMALVK